MGQLQQLFAQLELSDRGSVETLSLTKSFGWDASDAFQQHDVQEFFAILKERLEDVCGKERMEDVLCGQLVSWLECPEISYTSARAEPFSDVSLVIKGVSSVQDALSAFTQPGELTGKEQYRCEDGQLRDAVKGCFFQSLPPVLVLHLQRFEWDLDVGERVKLYHKVHFDACLDEGLVQKLTAAGRPGWVEEKGFGGGSSPPKYFLASVLVHSGGAASGHYFAYIRQSQTSGWCEFDDAVVKSVSEETVLAACGCDDSLGAVKKAKAPCAYLLVYRSGGTGAASASAVAPPQDVMEAIKRDNAVLQQAREKHLAAQQSLPVKVWYNGACTNMDLVKTQTVAEALKGVCRNVSLPDGTMARLRFYDTDLCTPLQDIAHGHEGEVSLAAAGVKSRDDLFLETAVDGSFQPYADSDLILRVLTLKSESDTFSDAKIVSVRAGQTIAELRANVSTVWGSEPETTCMVIVRDEHPQVVGEAAELCVSNLGLKRGSVVYVCDNARSGRLLALLEAALYTMSLRFNSLEGAQDMSVQIDSRWAMSQVKQKIAELLGEDVQCFKMFATWGRKDEICDLSSAVKSFPITQNDAIRLERGTPLHSGQISVHLSIFTVSDISLRPLDCTVELSRDEKFATIRQRVAESVGQELGRHLEAQNIRLRKISTAQRAERVLRDSETWAQCFLERSEPQIAVEILSGSASVEILEDSIVVVSRRFAPQTGEVSEGSEVVLRKGMRINEALQLLCGCVGVDAGFAELIRVLPAQSADAESAAALNWSCPMCSARREGVTAMMEASSDTWGLIDGDVIMIRDWRDGSAQKRMDREVGVSIIK